jgi:hypothetical protein
MNTLRSLCRGLAGLFLGLFILWQIFFLLGANILPMIEESKPYLKKESPLVQRLAPDWLDNKGQTYTILHTIDRAERRWSELTAQPQSWSLFAPNVFEHIPFPFVELRWEDDRLPVRSAAALLGMLAPGLPLEAASLGAAAEQVLRAPVPPRAPLRSDNEPADRHNYFRLGRFRLRRFEGNVSFILARRDRQVEELADVWREKIEDHLRREADCLRAFLRWRMEAFQAQHPELPPPKQVVLGLRLYRIPAPPGPEPWDWQPVYGEDASGPMAQPVLRWLPGAEPGPDYYPLEMYNPVMHRFESLRR